MDETNTTRHSNRIQDANFDTMRQHQCYNNFKESNDALKDKTYPNQISFSEGIGE